MTGYRRITGVLAGALLLTGCGEFAGMYATPLPGGADLGDHPFRLSVQFTDVLDLVPQAAVKVADVPIGRVEEITLSEDTHYAVVKIVVNGEVVLPANAGAELRQSSLLGEKFVELSEPSAAERVDARLGEGAVIPLAKTNRNPEVEEVLGALSLLLNGGGIEQLQTISEELTNALSGNEADIRALLSRVDQIATELDGHKGEIVRAIDGLNRLSSTLTAQTDDLQVALDDLAPGLQVVTTQRDQLVGMLQSLDKLSEVAVGTVNASRDDLIADLRALEPTLEKLAEAGQNLPTALKILPTYPFPDAAGAVVKGDYANVRARVDLNLDSLVQNFLNSSQPPIALPQNPSAPPPPSLPLPTAPPPLSVPGGGVLGGLDGLLDSLLGGG
ncbi:MCE family protein [Amycolatopsis magusensis]|uniref:Phospholipid/cholesterol/gamma-HCH transport system substrate-binding protein n=1 Tax=Amycolatopsis magusensis TaxID=882444 RepID=A0ABS4Q2Z4_9PSEU|nr:MCE family protein [Amycolatopsis magusensis]MBP2186049.1 phospholipid/cholesterol/gamma-HCH transport system substrate-binding protein [Amycolatopsis magusensis]